MNTLLYYFDEWQVWLVIAVTATALLLCINNGV
jgi:hypothetical protein